MNANCHGRWVSGPVTMRMGLLMRLSPVSAGEQQGVARRHVVRREDGDGKLDGKQTRISLLLNTRTTIFVFLFNTFLFNFCLHFFVLYFNIINLI